MTDAAFNGFDPVYGHPSRPNRPRTPVAQALERAKARLVLAAAVFTLAFTAIGIRLIDATVLSGGDGPSMAQAAGHQDVPAGRADITDRNGVILATSLPTQSLYADPAQVFDKIEAAKRLVAALPELNYAEVLGKLRSEKRFVWIKRNLTPRQHYAVHRLGIPGMSFQREERRIYPNGPLTAHVVGFTGVDNNGLAGAEQSFDKFLRAGTGPLQLSLDIRLQHILRRELANAINDFTALGGAGMIYDVRTGEVLAMSSLPDFDPQNPTGLDENTLFNRNTLGVYEMGSTFKIFNSAMALESGQIRLTDSFDASQPVHVGRFTISDYHGKNRWLTVAEIFQYSSNIGSVRMALQVGTQGQKAFLAKLGQLNPAPIEIPEVGAPMVPNPWRDVNTMTISFGHGLSVSPMQLVAGAAATINGGIMYKPTLLKRDEDNPPQGERVLSQQTSNQMRKLFRLVVTQGTAGAAAAPGYLVGGKTGTADKSAGRRYSQNARLSSFIGAFPMNDPRYIVFVMVDEPKANAKSHGYATGGWVAAPAVGQIIKQIGPLLGVPTVDENLLEIRRALDIDPPHPGSRTNAIAALPAAGNGR